MRVRKEKEIVNKRKENEIEREIEEKIDKKKG